MLRNLISFIIVCAGFCAACSYTSAQSIEPRKPFGRPAPISLDKLIRSRFKGYYGKQGWQYLINERFYPIGWSKDGKFAYLVERGSEDCDCYLAKLVVQDLRTDKILWEYEYEGEANSERMFTETLDSFWMSRRELFAVKLSEYEIEAGKSFVLLGPRINFQNDVMIPEVRIKRDAASASAGQISNVVMQIASKRKGKKIVYNQSYSVESHGSLIDAKVFGYLKSPFEPLVAFVMIEVHWGWEGPPHTTNVRIIGSSLSSGFK